jgi:hypothetical protein
LLDDFLKALARRVALKETVGEYVKQNTQRIRKGRAKK